jgi:hypothetical protein
VRLKKYWFILPAILAVAFHLPALFCGFVWDDVTLIQTNPGLATTSLTSFFSQDYGLQLGLRSPVGYYRPSFVAIISTLYRLGGPSPILFHAFSLVVFCIASTLSALACHSALDKKAPLLAMLAGCIYAAHPARTEVVSLVMSLPDLIVDTCCMTIILILLRQAKIKAPSYRDTIISGSLLFGSALLAITSKESAFFVLAGIAACLILRMLLGKDRRAFHILACVGIAAAGLSGLILNFLADINRPALTQYLKAVLTHGSAGAVRAVTTAIADIAIPGAPVFMQSLPTASSLGSVMLVILLISLLAAYAYALSRRSLSSCLLFGWFAAGLASLMMIGAVGLPYSQRYIPIAPAMIGIGILLTYLPSKLNRRGLAVLAMLYVVLLGSFSLGGSIKCRDNVTFFTFMADEQPDLIYPRVYLVDRLFHEHKNYELMEHHAREGIELDPTSPESATLRKFLARKQIVEGNADDAMALLQEASAILGPDAEVYWLQSACHHLKGDRKAAIALLERAVELEPTNVEYSSALSGMGAQR